MDVPLRFQWRKERDRYAAYPVGDHDLSRCVFISYHQSNIDTDKVEAVARHRWKWTVCWTGWFQESGYVDGKQNAADRATVRWWELVNQDPPRDVELEAAMIVARVLVRPAPNSLFAEETPFLHKVMWHLQNVNRAELKRGELPEEVSRLMNRLSEELYRRREQAG